MTANANTNTSLEPSVQKYFGLVHSIAGKIKRRLPAHVEVEDLVQTGMIGLLESCHRFDASRAVEFSSYANARITGAILDELRKVDTCSRQDRRTARAVEEARTKLRGSRGKEPEATEVAQAAGLTLREYHRAMQRVESGKPVTAAPEDSGMTDEIDNLPSGEENPFQSCSRRETWDRLQMHMKGLKPRLREVLHLYYFQEMGLKEIGRRLGVGEARVSQLHKEALVALRRKSWM